MKKILIPSLIIVILILLIGTYTPIFGQKTYVVDVNKIQPNVIINREDITGFDIQIWEAIAEDMGLNFRYREVPFDQIFKDLEDGKADVGIAAITINSERESYIDFSHHYLDSGLRIAVPNSYVSKDVSLKSIFAPLSKILIIFVLFLFLCCNALWYLERGNCEAISDTYFPGVFEALWCSIATMTTVGYGDISPKKWSGRICAFVIMLVGISLFGIVISQVTSTLTFEKFKSSISNYKDLRGRTVLTKSNTTSETILKNIGADVITFDNIDDAYGSSITNELPVVFDSPSVVYFANNEGIGKVSVVGDMFDLQYYGFALRQNSELREQINLSLLRLRDNGEYERIYKNWFEQCYHVGR